MRKGDTLVEVSLAIGIFSMVAIATVSVINGSTTGAQSALESTITREEIDGQAEALRFIQSAYVAGGQVEDVHSSKYATLWQNISNHAINLANLNEADKNAILNYNPVSCKEIYNGSSSWNTIAKQKAFLINTRAMNSNDWRNIIVDYNQNTFREAITYPRIVYNNLTSDELYDPANVTNYKITGAEGLYVIAVRDNDGTIIVSENGTTEIKSAYVDFYVRSCWFTPSASRASTISTVIRLYDPDALDINKFQRKGILIRYAANGASNTTGGMPQQFIFAGDSSTILESQFTQPGWRFKYWSTNSSGTGTRYNPGATFSVPANLTASSSLTLYAQWERLQAKISFNANGGTGRMNTQIITAGTTQRLSANAFSRTGYNFDGWTTNANGTGTRYTNRAWYTVPGDILNEQIVTLYAQWKPAPYTLTYNANGGSYAPAAQPCYLSSISNNCRITSSEPSRSGYQFLGWSESSTASEPSYTAGDLINITGNKTVYAVWRARNETIMVELRWGSYPSDLDAHVEGWRSDGSPFHAYYGNKVGSDVSGLTIAQLDRDVTSGYGAETFIINTLGGKNYYYYVHNYSNGVDITNATVTVSGPYIGTHTYYAHNASGSGRCWNVFAYKDGRIVYKGTRSNSPEIGY